MDCMFVLEERRETPVMGEYETVVLGGGPAGIAAAGQGGQVEMMTAASPTAASRAALVQLHILVFDRQVVDAALGRRDPAGHLAGLDDALHE